MHRSVIAAIFATLIAATPAAAQEKINVVATFSILADFVRNIGGDRVEVTALVGPNSDAHVYSPTPADARKVAAAKLVVVNGLGYEGWLERLIKASGTKAPVAIAARAIKPRRTADKDGHGHSHGATDPHAWQSVANAKLYVAAVRDALTAADPDGKATYDANAAAYLARLDALDKEVRAAIAAIPQDRRRIITNHEAFGYFAQAYGVSFIAPQGVSTEAQASARDVARIITQIKRQKIPAVFLENIADDRILKQIASETGAKVGGTLYSDSLTDANGPAPTYIDMMRHNMKTLSAALAN